MDEAKAAVEQARVKYASAAGDGSEVRAAAVAEGDEVTGLLAVETVTQGRSDREARMVLEKALAASWGQESISRIQLLAAEHAHSQYREATARTTASWERAVS